MKALKENNQNFWVSYATLMGGLFFVSILLVGAIGLKYFYVVPKPSLEPKTSTDKTETHSVMGDKLLVKKDTLEVLKSLLANEQAKNSSANSTIASQKNQLKELKKELSMLSEELKAQKQKNQEIINSSVSAPQSNDGSNVEFEKLKNDHQKMLGDLELTKKRIKDLKSIKIKAIKMLKEKLGDAIEVNPETGAIRLPSSVLFDVDAYELKDEFRQTLSSTLVSYINTLLTDKELRNYIDGIIIEGYTDSSGSYLYNLGLSQKRAFSVLRFLYLQGNINKRLMQKYVRARGMAYANVVKIDGVEDKEASRRIEVTFEISDKKALEEMDSFLKGKY